MNSRRFQLILSSLLLFAVVAACALSPAGSSTQSAGANPPLAAVTAANPPVSTAKGACVNAYFPVSPGNSWSYTSTGGTLGAYTYTRTVSDVGDAGFTTSDLYSLGSGTSSDVKWKCQDGKLAALDAGSSSLSVLTSKVKLTSTSITAEGYNIPDNFDNGTTWSEKVTINGTVQTGTRILDARIDSRVDCSAAGTESVTVPAGTFDAVKVTCTDTIAISELVKSTPVPAGAPSTLDITNWYAKGVGLVKSVRASSVGGTATIVLTQYKIQ